MKAKAFLASMVIVTGLSMASCIVAQEPDAPETTATDNPDFIELEAELATDSTATEPEVPTDSLMVDSASATEE